MALAFYPLTISNRREETADSISIALAVPPNLHSTFAFKAGQFLTLKANVDGQEQRRSYSICVSEQDYQQHGELRVGIKRVAGGLFSNWANTHLKAGHILEVMPPDGRFITRPGASSEPHYVGFAGGSGITPMLSLIGSLLASEPKSRFTLIYGNRSSASIMFVEALEDLKNRYLGRLRLYHVLSDEQQEIALFNGLLDQTKCQAFLDNLVPAASIDEAFVCGPEPMMNAAQAALLASGLAPEKIRIERFGSPLPYASQSTSKSTISNAGSPATPGQDEAANLFQVTIVANGKSRTVPLAKQGPSVLDAGLALGMDLPYACKGGVCCTCRARVLEGEVMMDKNYTLEANEIAAGFVLTCQCHPVSSKVVLSYDERL
jgi:ring-1,2-phenylacetyl-CoA epoxidase subunit PaaE